MVTEESPQRHGRSMLRASWIVSPTKGESASAEGQLATAVDGAKARLSCSGLRPMRVSDNAAFLKHCSSGPAQYGNARRVFSLFVWDRASGVLGGGEEFFQAGEEH
jgi:hypothetical protein